VQWQPRRGFRVKLLRPQDVEDLFAVQAFIAGELAARAAVALRRIRNRLLDAVERGETETETETETVERLNHDIHRAVNRAGGVGRLTSLLNLTAPYVPRNYYGRVQGWDHASAHDHEDIFPALETGDRESARAAMTRHVRHIGTLLIAHLRAQGAFASRRTHLEGVDDGPGSAR